MAPVVELSPEAEAMVRMKAAIRGQEVTEYVMALVELDEQQSTEADDTQRSAGNRKFRMSIQAVVFDADGVLVFPDRFAEHLTREHKITQEATRAFFQGKFHDCLLGSADLTELLPPYLKEWGWQGSAEEFMQLWFSVEDAVDVRVLDIAKTLREAGFVCCLASNQEPHRAKYMSEVMGFSAHFDHLFFSGVLGMKKPETQFYQAIETALGLHGEQIAFWDDSPAHVETAKQRGWAAERYTSYEEFRQQAKKLLETRKTQ